MLKKIAVGSTSLVAISTGIAMFAFSPTSCGCLSPLQGLVMAAGLDYYSPKIHEFSAERIETGLNSKLIGRKVSPTSPSILLDCISQSPTEFSCPIPVYESFLLARGFDVQFIVKPNGEFVRAHVQHSWAWL